ncbi:hypothetical protein Q5425_45030 [Amycolatopsis sp. A133]|uniref:hypothetical protein n=1 Tax=Amycolatopsis sp. A133 TaxID=3064472 RepID=UPI0027EF3531|nr:hypothetical protein [Amycolatopsis sp. A133]MDQ7810933.1 hypothetical protein [Amycolatopsis sp. A133]
MDIIDARPPSTPAEDDDEDPDHGRPDTVLHAHVQEPGACRNRCGATVSIQPFSGTTLCARSLAFP